VWVFWHDSFFLNSKNIYYFSPHVHAIGHGRVQWRLLFSLLKNSLTSPEHHYNKSHLNQLDCFQKLFLPYWIHFKDYFPFYFFPLLFFVKNEQHACALILYLSQSQTMQSSDNSFRPSAIHIGINSVTLFTYSSSSSNEQFNFQIPRPLSSFSIFPNSKDIASWSVRTAETISVDPTKSLQLFDIN